ncbi:MAG: hypothetical protein LBU22_07450 [Dysgonamonadaceae bacterium]|jgi:hypothetical protein|nr:hypothetical protein [Dysgonamonadaceae bacterium]
MNTKNSLYKKGLIVCLALWSPFWASGQTNPVEINLQAKAEAVDQGTIKVRWAPANARTWADGIKYGYTLERFTLVKDSVYQPSPEKVVLLKAQHPVPLPQWEEPALHSDYAAVIAQAIYGDDFSLTTATTSSMGEIINQANELQQRFATSVFMAEYDFKAAELAAWAYTDAAIDKKNRYLYRIILERPKKQAGDTAIVFIGYADKKDLPKPIDLYAVWADKAVMLSWNYELLSSRYHSYHVERKTKADAAFKRLNQLPVTLMSENKQSLFYTDSLPDNETEFLYRIIGITSFDEEGLPSDTLTGKGIKAIECVPHIYAGFFLSGDTARLFWDFNCTETGYMEKFVVKRAATVDGEYEVIKDAVPVHVKETDVVIKTDINYLKLFAVSKDGLETVSFPFALDRTDSIPPNVPTGLKVEIDTLAVAQLTWTANTEPDLLGYRILRSFTPDGEKSSITPVFITDNQYTDTLSLAFGNEKVYYTLTALDLRYNESEPCATVEAVKPNDLTPAAPRFTGYEIKDEGQVFLSWMTDSQSNNIVYTLVRALPGAEPDTIFTGNEKTNSFTDELSESGDYAYWLIAKNKMNRKETLSPQKISVSVTVNKVMKAVADFHAYTDTQNAYIELSWKKHPEAVSYSLYKKSGDKPVVFWKEIDASVNRIVDEMLSPDTNYEYTIVYTPRTGGSSQAKTIKVYF